jgi:hypothetical protein
MRLAGLRMGPDVPHLDKGHAPWKRAGWVNAQGIFAWGRAHDRSHLAPVTTILGQARATRP